MEEKKKHANRLLECGEEGAKNANISQNPSRLLGELE